MSPKQWKKIDELLDAALDLPAERHAAFLDAACQGDDELRRELESLLAAHQKAGSFIETTPAKGMASAFESVVNVSSKEATSGSLVGHKLGHYQIAALLGAGGMGEVYRARDPRLDRNVAIKVLPQHLSSHPDAMARFEREAKAVAALSHPNILAIYDFGHQDEAAYLVMELLEGATLRQRLKNSTLNWREAVKISAAIADGLAAAHAKGIIHRDIKPENIFLTNDGQIKILDFGIARVKRAVTSNAATLLSQAPMEQTRPGTLMGTIGYMSPEQVRGESVEAPGDIFSLGCLLIEMLTGERPFTRPSAPETLAAILRDNPPSIGELDPEIPIELERIVRRCLEKSPQKRFQSARDLALDLRSLLTLSSGGYRPISGAHRQITAEIPALQTGSHSLRLRFTRWAIPSLAVAFTAVMTTAGIFWWTSNRTVSPALNSLAVLPLLNQTDDKELEFLCDGITESVITNLSQFRPKLRVLASSSVRSYKGREMDPKQAGLELNVHSILTGKVLQQGNLLLIRVELVDTTDGSQLWSATYQQPRADLLSIDSLAIQGNISGQISEKLRLELTGEEQKLLAKRHTENKEANNLYLQGRVYWNRRKDEDLEQAIALYQHAIQQDKNFALAYAGIADAYALLYDGGAKREAARDKAEQYARMAISLDNQLAEPYSTLGFLEVFRHQNWQQAETYFNRAKELNGAYETAYHWHAIMLAIQGRFTEALDEIRRAKEFAPRSFPINKDQGEILFYARRYDEAIAQLRNTIAAEPKNPNVSEAYSWIRNCYERKGDLQSAINEFKNIGTAPEQIAEIQQAFDRNGANGYWQKRLELRLKNTPPTTPNGRMLHVFSYAAAGETEQAMKLLEQSISEDHHDGTVYLKVDPRFDNLRSHPRFSELLKRVNLQN
ncbi:MAG: protein kinase [Acidobacteria bacterium]|nr:protein kinase [Acidobacteriota bacterium]